MNNRSTSQILRDGTGTRGSSKAAQQLVPKWTISTPHQAFDSKGNSSHACKQWAAQRSFNEVTGRKLSRLPVLGDIEGPLELEVGMVVVI